VAPVLEKDQNENIFTGKRVIQIKDKEKEERGTKVWVRC